jgi:hypothetical protein
MLEVDKSFIFGEEELPKFLAGHFPQAFRLSDCHFTSHHCDFDSVTCAKVKFEETRLSQIESNLSKYDLLFPRFAQFFQQTLRFWKKEKDPQMLRCYSFISMSNRTSPRHKERVLHVHRHPQVRPDAGLRHVPDG